MRILLLITVFINFLGIVRAIDRPEWAYLGASALDLASSIGGHEVNPVLGRGDWGARQTAIKVAATGVVVLATRSLKEKHPRFRKAVLYSLAAGMTAVAAHNWKEH